MYPLRILVVDEYREAGESLADLLTVMGHEVNVAYDGRTALALAEKHEPTIVFLDLEMHGMNGFETVRRMRNLLTLQDSTIVAMSCLESEVLVRQAIGAGFDHYLLKPFSFDELQTIVAARNSKSQESASLVAA